MEKSILKNKNIMLLWTGQLISHAGDSIYMIALPWLILDLTGSKSTTSLTIMSGYLPSILFGLIAGTFADKYSRKKVMMMSDVLRSIFVLLVPISLIMGLTSPVLIGVITFIVATLATPFYPARDSLIPDIVSQNQLASANSIISTSGQMAHLLGPFLAGVLVSIVGITHLFTIDALSFSASLICISFLKIPRKENYERTQQSYSELIKSGIKYISTKKEIGALIFVSTINNFFIMGLAIIGIPVFVREVLDNQFTTLAILETSMATGMILGSIIIWRFLKGINPVRILLLGFVLDGLTYCLIYFTQTNFTAYLFLFIHGIGIPMITISRTLIVQLSVDNQFRGRIFSLINMSVMGTTAISVVAMGFILELLSVQLIFLIFGILAAACSLLGIFSKSFGRLKSLKT
ncbi:MAG: MFS transporter [Candidatus Marinimicrobia bacterium]|nr:MFS transporter [Candidatus Neomarinimicrobiota bacterium]